MKRIFTLTLALLVLGLLSGCSNNAPDGPAASSLGSATVTKYVAIGNSLTSGYESNALYASAQAYSFPNLIAQQLRAAGASLGTFEQPLYGDPGTPDAVTGKASRYEIISMAGPVIGPRGLTPGSPANLTLARPYDNLGVPGAVIYDFLDTTPFATKAGPPRNNPMFALILRNSAMGNSVFAQARALHPDLITFWLGSNDVLGYATSGGLSPSAPTSSAVFGALYNQALDSLRAALPNAKIIVANIPDVRAIPFFTTIGPKVAAMIPAGVTLRYQKHGNSSVAFDSTRLTEANAPLLTLLGSSYAPLLGKPGGKWYRDRGYPALPPGIDTTKPFGFHPQNPWPDALTLDADEQVVAGNAVASFNNIIAAVAASHGAKLMDAYSLLNQVKAGGYSVSGYKFTSDYITGGTFSLDGVHPSERGHAMLANEFIKVMNREFGMNVQLVNLATIPGIPAPVSKTGNGLPVIPYDAFRNFEWLFGASL